MDADVHALPYRVRLADTDTGEITTRGFASSKERFSWLASLAAKGYRVLEYRDPAPVTLEVPAEARTSEDAAAILDRLSYSSAGRKLMDELELDDPPELEADEARDLPDWMDPVSAWVADNEVALRYEAGRRQATLDQLLVDMLDDVFSIYTDETDLAIAEAQADLAGVDAKSRAADKPKHECSTDTWVYEAHLGAPGVGMLGHCAICSEKWVNIGGRLVEPSDPATILQPGDVI